MHLKYNVNTKGWLLMALLQIRVDDELKKQASLIFNEIGIDLSTAVRMFLKRSVQEGGLPFGTKIDLDRINAIIAIEEMRETSMKNGNSEMTLEEINEEIKAARKEKKKKVK